jgi:FKBP-type peptidyl-prolyl cis-trans isomerase FkpA
MKRMSLLLVCAMMYFSGINCHKSSSCSDRTPDQDEPAILTYLANNSITGYVKHSSGMYYKIEAAGTGAKATLSSKVYVKYTGKYTDNTIFDSQADAGSTGWVLGTLVQGWQIGIPLISKSGKIKLFIPSSLGYGCQTKGSIPGNSVLVFDIELVDVL